MSSWLSQAVGNINMDFNYDPAMANIPGMNLGSIAGNQLAISNQMLRGEGSFFDKQRELGGGMIRQQVSDQAANPLGTQNQAMASRGFGGGGLRDLMAATSGAQAGEQTAGALTNLNLGLSQQGFGAAGQFAGIGAQFGGMALQQSMANQQAQNEAKQYALTSAYNQAASNRANKGQFFGNVMNMASGLSMPWMTAASQSVFPSGA